MKMKSRLVQLCMNASTWSMVAILELGCIRVKGEIVRILTRHIMKVDKNFRDQERIGVHSRCTD